MKKKGIYQYYVEGDDEKHLLEVLKSELNCIESGKIDTFNVIQNKITAARIRPLKRGTTVVLVYDTDVEKIDVLQQNIEFLRQQSGIKEVICIPQVKKLEEELEYACQIKSALEITHSKSKSEFKSDLIKCKNLGARLAKCGFDISKFWLHIPSNQFQKFGNGADKIKLRN